MKLQKQSLLIITLILSLVCLFAGCDSKKPAPQPGSTLTNTIGMKLAYIPAGTFEMGSAPDEKGRQLDEFRHTVNISGPFRIGVTEVTQARWQAVMANNPSNFKGADLPVEKVSWKNAVAFCKKLSESEGKTYRLPTEAEWEYACRAGAIGAFAGTGNIDDMAWYETNSRQKTHPVATRQPNAWGLYDMHGNVAEWCADFYQPDYPEDPVTDPQGPAEGKYRVVRGGSWSYFARSGRCAARSSAPPSYQFTHTGFRVVMEIPK